MNPGTWVSGASDWVSGWFESSSDTAYPQPAPAPAPGETPKLTEDVRPKTDSTTERQKVAQGLVSDRTNAQYTEAEQAREGEPTRPLETEKAEPPSAPAPTAKAVEAPAPAPTPTVAAAAPAPSPAPAPAPAPNKTLIASSNADTPAGDTDSVVAPSARVKLSSPDLKTSAPPPTTGPAAAPAPAQVAAVAPPPPPQPRPTQPAPAAVAPAPTPAAAVARPVTVNGDIVGSVYHQRLAEFNSASAAPAGRAALAPAPAPAMNDTGGEGSTPATKVTAAHGTGGAHPLSALDQAKAAASFQVAEIMFGEGTAALSPADEVPLRAVADVYRDSKGTAKIGIVGHSDSMRLDVSAGANRDSNRSLASARAAAVARVLERLGVPAAKIYAGATGETAGDYAEVFVAY